MATLKDFLSELAIDANKLGQFIHDPEAAMTAAQLSDEDKAALRSGFPGVIYARMAGLSTEKAFEITLRPPVGPMQIVLPPQLPLVHQLPPQLPLVHQLPPQLPLVHQLPPQLPLVYQLPPQLPLVHQLPPTFQLPPQLGWGR
jgi:hypothetical protein